jgi:hypothetical protein
MKVEKDQPTKNEAYTCKECKKSVTTKFEIIPLENDFECECGEPYEVPTLTYCTKKCMKENCYWIMYGNDTLIIEDECNGCGGKIVFEVNVQTKTSQ